LSRKWNSREKDNRETKELAKKKIKTAKIEGCGVTVPRKKLASPSLRVERRGGRAR